MSEIFFSEIETKRCCIYRAWKVWATSTENDAFIKHEQIRMKQNKKIFVQKEYNNKDNGNDANDNEKESFVSSLTQKEK